MPKPTFTLEDDGTLDTVVRCDACGEELRFNSEALPEEDVDRVDYFMELAEEEHEHECEA